MPDNHLAGPIDALTGSYAGAKAGTVHAHQHPPFRGGRRPGRRIELWKSLPDISPALRTIREARLVEGEPVAARAQPDAAAQPIR